METFLLFLAGLIGGTMNALAGGGSGITFAALVFTGMPPIIANATNTFAATFGYLTGVLGYRKHMAGMGRDLLWQAPLVFIGGLIGGWALLQTEPAAFAAAVPWLLLFATLLFMAGGRLERAAAQMGSGRVKLLGAMAVFLTCIYGGYFQGGFGILTLAALSLGGYTAVRGMNGLKLAFAAISSIAAIILFALDGQIDYMGGLAVMLGIGIGSYGAARLTDYVSDTNVKRASLFVCWAVTLYAFYVTYG
jgi:uncharacterized membrane protein YfcA